MRNLQELRATPGRIAETLRSYAEQRAEIAARPRLSTSATSSEQTAATAAAREELRMARQGTLERLTTIQAEAEHHAQAIRNELSASLRPPPTGVTEALLRETAETRAWNRIKPTIDRARTEAAAPGETRHLREMDSLIATQMHVKELLRHALASGDETTIWTLVAEAPPYVEALAGKPTADNTHKAILGQISEHRPQIAATLADLNNLDAGMQAVRRSLHQATRAIEQDHPTVTVEPWPGEPIEPTDVAVNEHATFQPGPWSGAKRKVATPQG